MEDTDQPRKEWLASPAKHRTNIIAKAIASNSAQALDRFFSVLHIINHLFYRGSNACIPSSRVHISMISLMFSSLQRVLITVHHFRSILLGNNIIKHGEENDKVNKA